jgi:hypothetical protein
MKLSEKSKFKEDYASKSQPRVRERERIVKNMKTNLVIDDVR